MRFVVLEVADDFDYAFLNHEESGQKLVGVFQVPTKFCDPTDGHRGRKTQAGWTRGKKYGWWVCGSCKKPTEAWGKSLNAILSSARNLLNDGKDTLGAARRSESSVTAP
jgi:hypothetical protein